MRHAAGIRWRRLVAVGAIALLGACGGGPATTSQPGTSASVEPAGSTAPSDATGGDTVAIPAEADLAQALGDEEARLVAQARADAKIATAIGSNGEEALAALDRLKIEAADDFETQLQTILAGGVATAPGPLTGQLAAIGNEPPSPPIGLDGFFGATGIGAYSAAATVVESAVAVLGRSDMPDAYQEGTSPTIPNNYSETLSNGTRLSSRVNQTITQGKGGGTLSMTALLETLGTVTLKDGTPLGIVRETAKAHFEITACPDAGGVVTGKVTVHLESSFQHSEGGSETTATTDVDAPFRMLVNDNAAIIRTEVQVNVTGGATGSLPNGDAVDWNASSSLGLTWGSDDPRAGRTVNTQDQGTATKEQLGSLQAGAALLPILVGEEVRRSEQDFIWSGKCVDIELTAGQGRDVDPEEVVKITAQPRAHFGGEQLSVPVVATLDGKGKVEPQGSKVPAPADFKYTAGKEEGDIGTVHLKSTSKRGIGKLDVIYTVAGLKHANVSLAGSIQYTLPGITRSIVVTPAGAIAVDKASDGTLHGSGKVHVKFFNQYTNGCATNYEADIPVTIRVILENRNDKGEISIEVRGPAYPYFNLTSPDCMFFDDIATEFQLWAVGVGHSAAPDAGPHSETNTVSGGTYKSTTTMTR